MSRIFIALVSLAVLSSCSRSNGFRLLNQTGASLIVAEKSRDRNFDVPSGGLSRLMFGQSVDEYVLKVGADPLCSYDYPSLDQAAFPFPDGRRVLDGQSPRTLLIVAVDADLTARAYPFSKDRLPVAAEEIVGGGFPAQPRRTCDR